jgi:hypothetical protein
MAGYKTGRERTVVPSSQVEGRASRICINLRSETHDLLRAIARQEGRSLSNLCAHLLEQMLDQCEPFSEL